MRTNVLWPLEKKKWVVTIKLNGKRFRLLYFAEVQNE